MFTVEVYAAVRQFVTAVNSPARTVVPVVELHHGCLVEIDAIGVVK